MICPDCKEEMLILEYLDVEIDYCDSCRGIWLDEGELELIAGISDASGEPFVAALSGGSVGAVDGERKCPVCCRAMLLVELPIEPPVQIDRCPVNHGLWFDHGELDAVIGAAAGTEVGSLLKELFAH